MSVGAHCAMSRRPTRVLPVKESLRTAALAASTPAVAAWSVPTTRFTTPGGRPPASAASCTSAMAVSGVSGAGRSTTVQPAASAGASLRAGMAAGKFQGVSSAAGPTGAALVSMARSARAGVSTSPCGRAPSSAYSWK